MKKIFALLLTLVMALGLAACGGGSSLSDEESAAVGKYTLISYTYSGLELSADSGYLELKDNGKADLEVEDTSGTVKWSLADGVLTITEGSDSYTGELDGNVITLEMEDIIWLFALEGSAEETQLREAADGALDDYINDAFDEALSEAE